MEKKYVWIVGGLTLVAALFTFVDNYMRIPIRPAMKYETDIITLDVARLKDQVRFLNAKHHYNQSRELAAQIKGILELKELTAIQRHYLDDRLDHHQSTIDEYQKKYKNR